MMFFEDLRNEKKSKDWTRTLDQESSGILENDRHENSTPWNFVPLQIPSIFPHTQWRQWTLSPPLSSPHMTSILPWTPAAAAWSSPPPSPPFPGRSGSLLLFPAGLAARPPVCRTPGLCRWLPGSGPVWPGLARSAGARGEETRFMFVYYGVFEGNSRSKYI